MVTMETAGKKVQFTRGVLVSEVENRINMFGSYNSGGVTNKRKYYAWKQSLMFGLLILTRTGRQNYNNLWLRYLYFMDNFMELFCSIKWLQVLTS